MSTFTQIAKAGARGIDCNNPLTDATLRAAKAKGYSFAVRYVGRRKMAAHDLSRAETSRILSAGVALMVVQHVENEGWSPSEALGREYGANAARFALECGYERGCTLWLDLEGVSGKAKAADADAYCRAWWKEVNAARFQPGIYVGWSPGLSAAALYRLPFTRYWGAYNVNADQVPKPRGWCMKQSVARNADMIPGVERDGFDVDVIQPDGKGGLPVWLR